MFWNGEDSGRSNRGEDNVGHAGANRGNFQVGLLSLALVKQMQRDQENVSGIIKS